MKTFKKFIKEASGFPTGPVGENPKNLAGEVTDTLGSDVFNEKNLKSEIPFGPYIITAGLIYFLFGNILSL